MSPYSEQCKEISDLDLNYYLIGYTTFFQYVSLIHMSGLLLIQPPQVKSRKSCGPTLFAINSSHSDVTTLHVLYHKHPTEVPLLPLPTPRMHLPQKIYSTMTCAIPSL